MQPLDRLDDFLTWRPLKFIRDPRPENAPSVRKQYLSVRTSDFFQFFEERVSDELKIRDLSLGTAAKDKDYVFTCVEVGFVFFGILDFERPLKHLWLEQFSFAIQDTDHEAILELAQTADGGFKWKNRIGQIWQHDVALAVIVEHHAMSNVVDNYQCLAAELCVQLNLDSQVCDERSHFGTTHILHFDYLRRREAVGPDLVAEAVNGILVLSDIRIATL